LRTGLGQKLVHSARQRSFTYFYITETQFAVGAGAPPLHLTSNYHPSTSDCHFFGPLTFKNLASYI